jgi:bifunctional non-homologous end joining protein LigD
MGGALAPYRAKRRFKDTPEPHGQVGRTAGHRYSIQKHAARRLHYDLRLELDGVLKSWAVTKGPSLDPADKRLAVRVEDHPIEYSTFEGRIPTGNYGAGTVLLWDEGTWEPIGDPHAGLETGKLVFHLHGERLRGKWALVRFHARRDSKHENWLLIKEHDADAARGKEVTTDVTTSVASGRDLDAIAAAPEAVWHSEAKSAPHKHRRRHGKPPAFAPVALATLVDTLPQGEDWLFEMKFDGYRALAAASGDDVRIYTRNGKDWTDRFRAVARAIAALDLDRALLDGEIVALDNEGRPDFSALQRTLSEGGAGLTYFVFDLLALGGKDMRAMPLIARKERLRGLLAGVPRNGPLAYTDHVLEDGRAMYRTLCARRFEGVIAKRTSARYRAGRGPAWLKIKCRDQQEFVIVGWSGSTAARPFASILLAQHVSGHLHYAGRAGSGFTQRDLAALERRFKALAQRTSPLDTELPRSITRGVHWLKPDLVAEVAFAEFTGDGIVRHARFIGLREDKEARTVERERTMATRNVANDARDIDGVRLTHPDKVLYPTQGLTKRDIASYLAAASDRMLPHLADRPLSLMRYPNGLGHPGFFQRHPLPGMPTNIHPLPLTEADGDTVTYLSIGDRAGLLAAAQFDVLEFHIWGVRIDDVDRPDRIVFDLDPDPALDFALVREAADHLRAALEALELASFALLTGGKGVHVVVPIIRRHPWPVVKQLAKALAERFAHEAPERYVANMRKTRRKGKIFIDIFRNDRTASAIAPYSLRARDAASVAWPVTWAELAKAASADMVTLSAALRRLAAPDPWKDYRTTKQRLSAAALRALNIDT